MVAAWLPLVVVSGAIAAGAAAAGKAAGLPAELTGSPLPDGLAAELAGLPRPLRLPLLLLPLAVFPAAWEEVFCRGFLGRGLVARFGPVGGVVLTAGLFGAVHLHPVQAAYAVFLGLALHAIYLWGKSLVLPVLLHFLINGLAAGGLLAGDPMGAADWLTDDAAPPPALTAAAVLWLAGIGWAARAGRVRWVLPEGREWWPGFVTAEPPPARLGAVAVGGRVGLWPWLAVATGAAAFVAAAALTV